MSEVNISGFSGSNNVLERFYSGKNVAEPRIILNADCGLAGSLTARHGKTAHVTLSGCHSLWAGTSCMLCVASGVLYSISNGVATSLGSISGPTYPLSYTEAENKVYASNPYWQGVFTPSTGTVSSWGVELASGPMLSIAAGNLPPGKYNVTFTNVSGTELSGNGPIASITLAAEGGIQILNRPAGALVWATDSDEYIFYLVGAVDTIVDIPTVEPLPSFMCSPPPFLDNICYAFGCIWGSSGPDLYYSQPFHYGWFRLTSNKFSFDSTVTIIADVATGIFVGTESSTFFLAGTEPDKMQQSRIGEASIKGTLAYCNNLPDLESVLGTAEKGQVSVPVWMTTEGIVAGSNAGTLYNLTKNKIKTGIPARGASLYRNLEGMFQFLTSFRNSATASAKGFSDDVILAAFKAGKIDDHTEDVEALTNRANFSDSATCTVTRGGVII